MQDKNTQLRKDGAAPKPLRRAAMYVRMSTDHQKYSTENQSDAIKEYATRYNIEIISTYADAGKSGLTIGGREALQRLIKDVESGNAKFNTILVLDVSRWGRFQDVDEGAHYEYICRRAGISVQFVAEQFESDDSLGTVVVKGVKRAMAKEYSRELSAKVSAGQKRLIQLGYRQGGTAGYGLRRMLIDEHGNIKTELLMGEHKSIQTDRVILVNGPEEEINIVKWIYSSFVERGLQESQIAAELNRKGILTDFEREWTRGTVHEVLSNEKYIGNNVYNRTSGKLKTKRVHNSPDLWVRADGAFAPLIETALFFTAQGMIRERSRKLSDEEMLTKLKSLHEKQGWLSGLIIDETENMPSSGAYHHRFGSLLRAYELIGYTPDIDYSYIEINRQLRKLHSEVIKSTIAKIEKLGGRVYTESGTELLITNEEIKVSVVICRCFKTEAGSHRWKIHLDTGLKPDITIAIRMDATNEKPLDYYLLPAIDIENPNMRLSENNGLALDAYRFDNLEPFFTLTERVSLPEAA